ncbi:M56 family metallopeptidase [uncultured Draconibacterium sp.]|uniref:M56 family metallopeptidase n=1 Tax=uncultured Draconibacterium sp. TaxID=1573823 RepID=UPI0032171FC8
METLLIYLGNASTGIVLFYLMYWFFLRKETFHSANRIFLVLGLVCSVVLPLFPLQYSVLLEAENTGKAIKTISDTFKHIPVFAGDTDMSTVDFGWQQAILLVYLTGAAIFLLRLLIQSFVLIHLMIKYRIKSINGIRIVENEKYGLPFSFFNVVFINPKFHTQDDLPEILAHEQVHIRENHWFDLLFIELLTVIFWFNPFIWFFERSIKQNHEYLADKGVLAQGHTVGRYQALLVNQLMGMQIIGITNNLNFALNTNRLKMMTKMKTSRKNGVKFTLALPVLAFLLFAFAEPQYKVEGHELNTNINSMSETTGEKELTIHGKVILDDSKEPLPGASVILKGTTIGVVSDRDGTFKLVDPNPKKTSDGSLSSEIVISFVGKETIVNTITASGEALNNGKYTFLMKDAVIVIDTDVPPPPPPPAPATKKESSTPPPPPPPGKTAKTKLSAEESEQEVFFVVEDMPKYPGGQAELAMHVQKMQKKLASAKNISGKAKVSFTVSTSGKVTDIKVVEKDNDMAAKGAYAIVSGLEDWTPGKQRGKAVSVKYLLPVEFK